MSRRWPGLTGLIFVSLLGACQSSEEAVLSNVDDIINHDDTRFALINCELFAANADAIIAQKLTGIDGTCEFARQSDESVQIYVKGDSTYALVVASVPHDDDKFCDTTIRAVRLDASRLQVSDEEQNILMCTSGPFDEQMIVTLSDSVPTD